LILSIFITQIIGPRNPINTPSISPRKESFAGGSSLVFYPSGAHIMILQSTQILSHV